MRERAPDVQLLYDGDILHPVERDGGWRMARVTPDDDEYAAWLRVVQDQNRQPGLLTRGIAFWSSAALLYVGLIVLVMVVALLAHAVA